MLLRGAVGLAFVDVAVLKVDDDVRALKTTDDLACACVTVDVDAEFGAVGDQALIEGCLLYTSPSPRD